MSYLKVVDAKNPDGRFLLLDNDNSISFAIRRGERYQPWVVEWARKYIRENSVVLDVGANIGTDTVAFAKLMANTGKLYAFEPQRVIFQQLCANVFVNGITNVYSCNYALGDKADSGDLYVCDLTKGGNFGQPSFVDKISDITEKVEIKTLDSLNLMDISFIKVDIQMFEYQFLLGATETLKREHPFVVLELCLKTAEEKKMAEKCTALMTSLGYKLMERHGKDVLFGV